MLMRGGRVLLLDEITNGLDSTTTFQVMSYIASMAKHLQVRGAYWHPI